MVSVVWNNLNLLPPVSYVRVRVGVVMGEGGGGWSSQRSLRELAGTGGDL